MEKFLSALLCDTGYLAANFSFRHQSDGSSCNHPFWTVTAGTRNTNLQGVHVLFSGSDTDGLFNRNNKDLAVPYLP